MAWDDDYEEDDPCDHEDLEINVIDGRAFCYRCGEAWNATPEQIQMQIDHEASYYEALECENRRQWWRDLWGRIRSIFRHPKSRDWVSDDDVPF